MPLTILTAPETFQGPDIQMPVPLKPGAHPSTQHLASENQDGAQAFFCIRIHTNKKKNKITSTLWVAELFLAIPSRKNNQQPIIDAEQKHK